MEMNPYSQATFTTAIATTFLGLFVLSRDCRNKLYQVFALYSIAITWFGVTSGLYTMVESTDLALFLARILHIGTILIPIFFTKFVLILTNRLEKDKRWLYSAYLFGLLLFFLLPSPHFVNRVVPDPPLRQALRGGPMYVLIILFFYIYISRALFFLYKSYRKSRAGEKRKLGYLLWSSVLGYIGGSLVFLYVYDIPHPIILSYAVYTIPIYVCITTYAIIKHRLLDINIVFKRSLVYSLLVTSLTLIYLIIVLFLERTFQTAIGYRSLPATAFVLLTIAIVFQPLKNRFQRFVDINFFRGTLESLAEEKEKLQEEVRRTDQLRIAATLASGIAHEIKNPLTNIKTFTNFLPERHQDKIFVEKFRTVVGEELGRVEGLVKDLLDFARPHPPKSERIDVHVVLGRVIDLVSHGFQAKNIRLVTSFTDTR